MIDSSDIMNSMDVTADKRFVHHGSRDEFTMTDPGEDYLEEDDEFDDEEDEDDEYDDDDDDFFDDDDDDDDDDEEEDDDALDEDEGFAADSGFMR